MENKHIQNEESEEKQSIKDILISNGIWFAIGIVFGAIITAISMYK